MSDVQPDAGILAPLRNTIRAVVTVPPFLARHAWRNRVIERSHTHVDELSEPPPPHRHHPHLQSRDSGVGPIMMRTYEVDIADPVLDAATLIGDFRADPNQFNSNLVAGVRPGRPSRPQSHVDDEVVVELPGPWNGPCTTDHVDDTTVILATLDGHMEAGHSRFATVAIGDGGYTFQIRSWARAGDLGFAALHVGVPIAKELQTAMWYAMCERAVAISGGTRTGPIRVCSEELDNSDRRGSS